MTQLSPRIPESGESAVLVSGHRLATEAGMKIIEKGGNAVDAAAAMCFCLNLVQPHQNGIGGEVPIILRSARDGKTVAISGQGTSPLALTIDWCRDNGIDLIPGDGYIPATVPAVVGTWALALKEYGTMSFGEILEPTIEVAGNGYEMFAALQFFLRNNSGRIAEHYPHTADIYLPDGNVPKVGDIITNPDFAAMLKIMVKAEDAEKHKGREAGIDAACDAFYRGEIAERIVSFITQNPVIDASGKTHTGLLSVDDFAKWKPKIEEPVTYNYKGYDVWKCSSWTQGPVFLQQLGILEGFDIEQTGHQSVEYLHNWIECAKLAFADREAYYGDPEIDIIPIDVLLARGYAGSRRKMIGPEASMEIRPGGAVEEVPDYNLEDVLADNRESLGFNSGFDHYGSTGGKPSDTMQLAAADKHGNLLSATPSGGWIKSSPVISGLGFCLGTRGQMFYLNPKRPNALAPRKRPRTTLTPTVVTKDEKPFLAFGTPGGDQQDQWTLQFFLNTVDFGMDLQSALDSPHFHINHVPASFYPRKALPGKVVLDSNFPDDVAEELRGKGHRISKESLVIRMMAVHFDDDGKISGSCCSTSPEGYAMGV